MVSLCAAWHTQSSDEVLGYLSVLPTTGLTHLESIRRLTQYGHNTLLMSSQESILLRIFKQFNNPLFYLLCVASLITLILGDRINAGVIISMVIINVAIGVLQEGKASKALESLNAMLSIRAIVLRDGEKCEVDAMVLVPGDIVFLEAGTGVPADLRLISTKNITINEAILTGESMPTKKNTESVAIETPLSQRYCMAYSGTVVGYGSAHGIVVGTGSSTEIGRISGLMRETEILATPLSRRLNQFAQQITLFIILLGLITFFYGYYLGTLPTFELFLAVVGLAVAGVPEGLPAIVTIVLAIGTRFMLRHHVIVRRLSAVEALGSVTVICSDKTGTLTKNEMTVIQAVLPTGVVEVRGVGYAPEGEFYSNNTIIEPMQNPDLQLLAWCALLCNDAYFKTDPVLGLQLIGDPTEGALLTFAYKAGLDLLKMKTIMPRVDELAFQPEQRFMATLHSYEGHRYNIIFLKGAPERIFELCLKAGDQVIDYDFWNVSVDNMAHLGQRVLALAYCEISLDRLELSIFDVTPRFTLLGLVGLSDPPREEAITAVKECQGAGVNIKMVTGDHLNTAKAIAQQLGIKEQDVIARASPEDKLQLVKSLQAQGELVAVTGDGVNDAPALRAADIGIAMGKRGTDAAREASDLVLTDDNFATITYAVREGRVVYDNIKKSLLFILPINGGEAGVILLAVLFGLELPVTVSQILWVNLIIEMTLGFTLAFELAEPDVMLRGPRSPLEPLITRILIARIIYVSFLAILSTFIVFEWELSRGNSIELARTAAVNMLVFGGLVYLFNVRRFTASAFTKTSLIQNRVALWMSLLLISFQLVFTYMPFMQKIFHTVALDFRSWCIILFFSFCKFFAVELEKFLLRYFGIQHM